jgi:DNA-binding transcriptional LysR family regulator
MQAVAAGVGIALLRRGSAAPQNALIELPIPVGVPNRAPWLTVHRDVHRDPAIRKVHRWILNTFTATRRAKSTPEGLRGDSPDPLLPKQVGLRSSNL